MASPQQPILEAETPAPVKPLDDGSPSQCCEAVSGETLSQGHPPSLPWILTPKNCKSIKVCYCFKLLNFGVLCYTARDNRHKY